MKFRKIIYSVLSIGIIILIICGVIIWNLSHFGETKVVFLNVGQGDAILISHGTNQILIDGGPDGTVLMEQLGKQMPFWDRNIEIVIATHPDADHIDGLVSVFKNYSVNQFWHTTAGKNTSVYKALNYYLKDEKGVEKIIAYKGLRADIANDTYLDVIYPFSDNMVDTKEMNDSSIGVLLSVGDEAFYLAGDLTSKIEDTLPIGDEITVLKASHHGSKFSTSDVFLQKTKPRDVIFSVGKNNRYGHPNKRVLESVKNIGAHIFRTDEEGTIIYRCKDECKIIK